MIRWLKIATLALVVAVIAWQTFPVAPPIADIPIAGLRAAAARGAIATLAGPLPDWLPLPESGRVVTAGAYKPQPPYGAAVSITLRIEDLPVDFAAAYESRLAAAGYAVRRVAPPLDFTFASDLALDAFDAASGRYVVCVLRHTHAARFAQITFWEPPAPRLR